MVNTTGMTDTTIVHSDSPLAAAFEYARVNHLPIGSTVDVVDPEGKSVQYTVKRSSLSKHMLDGGDVQLVKKPLTGGGHPDDILEQDHIVHAQNPAQAAMLFAAEANLPPNTYVRVSTQDQQKYQFYRTPAQ